MRIEEVEALESSMRASDYQVVAETAITALRAEAWHPIEKADELGAKYSHGILVYEHPYPIAVAIWNRTKWSDCRRDDVTCNPTHFRFINPPEEA